MIYLVTTLWPWMLAALTTGLIVGATVWFPAARESVAPRSRPLWPAFMAGLMIIGVVADGTRMLRGEPALWLETALLLGLTYAIGCLAGSLVVGAFSRAPRQQPATGEAGEAGEQAFDGAADHAGYEAAEYYYSASEAAPAEHPVFAEAIAEDVYLTEQEAQSFELEATTALAQFGAVAPAGGVDSIAAAAEAISKLTEAHGAAWREANPTQQDTPATDDGLPQSVPSDHANVIVSKLRRNAGNQRFTISLRKEPVLQLAGSGASTDAGRDTSSSHGGWNDWDTPTHPATPRPAGADSDADDPPPALPMPQGGSDDLTLIKGIGPVIAQKLHRCGVWSYAQIGSWSESNATWISAHLEFPGRVQREHWVAQACLLASGGETAHARAVRKGTLIIGADLDAPLSDAEASVLAASLPRYAVTPVSEHGHPGTRPEGLAYPPFGHRTELSLIEGVGWQTMTRLHGLGIWTVDQIASWTADNAEWMNSYLGEPGRIEREDWVSQARVLEDVKLSGVDLSGA